MLFSQRTSIPLARRFDRHLIAIDICLRTPNSKGGRVMDVECRYYSFLYSCRAGGCVLARDEAAIAECSIKRCTYVMATYD